MAKVDVEMPQMGESITEGTIIVWHKQPGDEVEQDEMILEIGTDKVDTEVPAPVGGVLVEIRAEEGDLVEVGTTIAVIETEVDEAEVVTGGDGDGGAPAEAEAAEADAAEAAEPEPEPVAQDEAAPSGDGAQPSPSGGAQTLVDVIMPKMGESITEGTVVVWHKEVGDPIDLDETILEIGTDKVDTEVPSPAAGVLAERLYEEGAIVEVGTVIARIGSEADAAATPSAAPPAPAATPEPEPATTAPSGDGAAQRQPVAAGDDRPIERRGEDGRFYSPLVRSIAEEEGLSMGELEGIDGSGREGRVTKHDILAYLDEREADPAEAAPAEATPAEAPTREAAPQRAPQRPAQPASAPARPMPSLESDRSAEEIEAAYDGRVEVVEMDRMRRITAEHMVRSKATSAHVTSFAEADVTGMVHFRQRHKEGFLEREGVKLTYTPFFVKAAVDALREHPILNASVEGDKILIKKDFHVGIAVAIGKKGLLAPVIRNAGDMNLVGLAKAAADTAERARNKRLQPDELQGGTFTVTNIGTLGSVMGTPIINQPQVAILATGAIKKRPVVIEDPQHGDVIAVRHIMYACLSYDHRIIDGAMGSSFLKTFVDVLEGYDAEQELYG
jgi:2-oxoglutarate dehydrogenase E2 component (dihydrolipoamide succinyltransferase)